MGLYDRDYTRADYQPQPRYAPRMRMAFPRLTPAVKWLLIINVAVYFVQILGADTLLVRWFAVYPRTGGMTLQIWRLITYQFLHDGIRHILFNMLCLFFLGPMLERHWRSKKFLVFYLGCGMAGGLIYPLLLGLKIISPHPVQGVLPLVGASGAILGVLATCAILFPQVVVLFIFVPLSIRVVALILTLFAIFGIITGENAGGEAAHLAGMAAGAAYVFSQSWRAKMRLKIRSGQWEKKMAARRSLQLELDRILQKVHDSGIHRLTSKEKRILKQATKAEQMRNEL